MSNNITKGKSHKNAAMFPKAFASSFMFLFYLFTMVRAVVSTEITVVITARAAVMVVVTATKGFALFYDNDRRR